MKDKGITIKQEEDSIEWYTQVVIKSKLADFAPVKGCMVIRPYGYMVWQNIQDKFNKLIQNVGVENSYFPLFIPENFFKKEAKHAKGFSPEVAWIERKNDSGDRLAIRPTSETIMYDSYSKWIRSWRDLPLKINQWCNVVRWEVSDVRLFLRSREFLWQEGHCVYETEEECDKESRLYLDYYQKISEDLLAMPTLKGYKSEKEKFAGASRTYAIEGFSKEGKALQLGTTHNLGQGFAKAFKIKYVGKDEKNHFPWQNSWGFSTRLIGGMILSHSDDKGLVLPPNVAPLQVIMIPVFNKKTKSAVLKKARMLIKKLKSFRSKLDDSDYYTSGWKFNEYELKGVPLRIEIGPRDIENKQVILVKRNSEKKRVISEKDLTKEVKKELENIQKELFKKAKKFLYDSIIEVTSWYDFKKTKKKLIKAPFCGSIKCEELIKEKTKLTTRLTLLNEKKPINKNCIHCKNKANQFFIFGRSY